MNIENNTILITGGATGIGFALAKHFLAANNNVIICGRRAEALLAAKQKLPKLQIRVADLNNVDQRNSLVEWTTGNFSNLNILVNNAGIEREFRVKDSSLADDFLNENEIETNLTAPIHLTFLLLPQLLKQREAAVVNVSSGLGFVPIAVMPIYCATKAAMQSFSKSLRYQLKETSVKVFDVAPPLVETELHEKVGAKSSQPKGILPEQVAKKTLQAIRKDNYEIAIGLARVLRIASKIAPSQMFKIINQNASGE
ncbi:SDR family NAD(P)-dependent oxidoreductase (plasmid) [Phormidium sp. CLA17]|uniref:SDR family oxidoreductase n=1 Tax=Leptolyngbya sp. Cla-17 TaxID=2803751 RepID=UPI001490BB03|nr:SDR family NAD(P)-dependent oxidoreductase [Leptolyngbya sp. Cla-17]MBM0745068.1 SDR family NAD(P)-dependent oxidoreductase [Leptolyngbya sp. Cla-17]